jgi:hypothetical protein
LHGEGHFGQDKTLVLVLSDYYWPTLTSDEPFFFFFFFFFLIPNKKRTTYDIIASEILLFLKIKNKRKVVPKSCAFIISLFLLTKN